MYRQRQPEPRKNPSERSRQSKRLVFRRSMVLMGVFGLGLFIPLLIQLCNIAIVHHDEYQTKAIEQQLMDVTVSANRGEILDANGDVLAIGKESFCGHPLTTTEEESVWLAPRQDGTGVYCALFNLSEEERTVRVDPAQLDRPASHARELWTGREEDPAQGIAATLPAHDAAVYLLTF